MREFDLLVIGGGSGGVRGARWAASLGAKVALCEDRELGGTCVVRGCIPKKMMVYASDFEHEIHVMKSYGHEFEKREHNWKTLKKNRDLEIQRLSKIYEGVLEKNQVELIRGRGKVLGPNRVEIGGEEVKAKHILIATGSKPWMPKFPGVEHCWSSNEVFLSEKKPETLLIMGGGYIGLEMACIFQGLGTKVTLLLRAERPLRLYDKECAEFLVQEIKKMGIELITESGIERIEKKGETFQVQIKGERERRFSQVLLATGRRPNTQELFSPELNVKLDERGAIIVNSEFQSSVESIYAVGDVIDQDNLTPVALAQAMNVTNRLFANQDVPFDRRLIPTAVFSTPELATVGLTEEEAMKDYDIHVFTSEFKPLKETLMAHDQSDSTSSEKKVRRTFMKMIVDQKTDRVLGVHMVGDHSGEIVQGLAVALKAGALKKDFDSTIGIHPTSAEEFVTMREPARSVEKNPHETPEGAAN